jgi:signal transduction histidine kinase
MKTLLGVPIKSKGRVIGDLYLADKISPVDQSIGVDFTDNDELILEMFATQAAIAIDNAKLYRQSQDLILLRERERFGMDLHDGIIQSIYAVGLMLEDIQRKMVSQPEKSGSRISDAITGLNEVIRDLRNYILDLRPQKFQGKNLVEGLEELAKELRANTLISVNLYADNINPGIFSPEQTVEILHVAQEALTNIHRHARATLVEIRLQTYEDQAELRIEDNGRTISEFDLTQSDGNGLRNMRERAIMLNGEIKIEPNLGKGTRVLLLLPLKKETIQ